MPILTIYPQAGSGGSNTTVDGWVGGSNGAEDSWSDVRDASPVISDDTSNLIFVGTRTISTPNTWFQLTRGIFTFDVSFLNPASLIRSCSFCIQRTVDTGDPFSVSLNITSASPASNNAIVNADFALANFGTDKFSTDRTLASVPIGSAEDFEFNDDGKNYLLANSIAGVSLRMVEDIDNSAPSWVSGTEWFAYFGAADVVGTSIDPCITIDYVEYFVDTTDTISLSESLVKVTSKLFEDIMYIGESINVAGALVFFESLELQINESFSLLITKPLTESFLVKSITNFTFFESVEEVISVVDTFVRAATKNLSEVITVVSNVYRGISANLSDTITVVSSFLNGVQKSLLETISLAFSFNVVLGRIFTDSIVVVETFIKTMGKIFENTLIVTE